MVEGTQSEIDRAGSLLGNRGLENWNVYDMAQSDRANISTSPAPMNQQPASYREAMSDRQTLDIDKDNSPEVEIIDKRTETR